VKIDGTSTDGDTIEQEGKGTIIQYAFAIYAWHVKDTWQYRLTNKDVRLKEYRVKETEKPPEVIVNALADWMTKDNYTFDYGVDANILEKLKKAKEWQEKTGLKANVTCTTDNNGDWHLKYIDIPSAIIAKDGAKVDDQDKDVWMRLAIKVEAKGTDEKKRKAAFWVYQRAENEDNQWAKKALNGPNPAFPITSE
jgi:hypothetical protein